MLDTNVCIYAIKKKSPNILQQLISKDPKDVCISSITYAELMRGISKSRYRERSENALNAFLSEIEILDFDQFAAAEYGKIRAQLEKKGTPIGPLDMLLAGHAVSEDCIFVTHNTREFERVEDLKTEDWF